MIDNLTPDQIGRELRTGSGPFLKRRRKILGLTFFSCGVLGYIALCQTGILKELPEPRWRGLDAEKVDGSPQAYSILRVPDALLDIASYAVTACLAGHGPENRWQTHPLMPIGMGLKVIAHASVAGKLTWDESRKYRAFSLWSLLAVAATWTALPLAIPETRAAVRRLIGQQHV